jgi:Mg2+ and Co2+ transporter CorA
MIQTYRTEGLILVENTPGTPNSLDGITWIHIHEISKEESQWIFDTFNIKIASRQEEKFGRHRKSQQHFNKVVTYTKNLDLEDIPSSQYESSVIDIGRIKILDDYNIDKFPIYHSIQSYLINREANQILLTSSFQEEGTINKELSPISHILPRINQFMSSESNPIIPDFIEILIAISLSCLRRDMELLDGIEDKIDVFSQNLFGYVLLDAEQTLIPKARNTTKCLYELIVNLGKTQEALNKANRSLIRSIEYIEELKHYIPMLLPRAKNKLHQHLEKSMNLVQSECKSYMKHGDSIRNRIEYLSASTQSMIQIKQNDGNKFIAAVAGIFIPPNLLAGFMGMNFISPPNIPWQVGMPSMFALMLLTSLATYKFMRSRQD